MVEALPSGGGRVWKYAKWLLRESAYAIPSAVAYLEGQLDHHAEADDFAWTRWHVLMNRGTPTGTSEDQAQFKFDVVNITGGAVDSTWTAADFAAVKTSTDTWLTALKSQIPTSHQIVAYKAYLMRFNPSDPGPGIGPKSTSAPFLATGPPVYSTAVSITGTGTSVMPYQVAASVTLRTGWPRHWGRFYVPWGAGALGANGRFGSPDVTAIANTTHAHVTRLADQDFMVVVPVGQADKQAFHALLGVSDVVVDDIPDVVRRRRPRQAAVRQLGTG